MAKKTQEAQEAQVQDAVIVNETENQNPVVLFVDNTVKKEVVKIDVAKAEIEAKIKKYKSLKVKDKDDEKGIALVKDAYNDLVKTRTSIDKKRKEVGKPFSDIKAGIDKYANDLVAMFAAVEAQLKTENDKVKLWEKEEQERKEREEQERKEARVKELVAAGIVFDGELYVINEITVDIVSISKFSDFDYNALLEKVKIEKAKNDEAEARAKKEREEQEQKSREEAERVERERKENRAEKLEMRTEKLEVLGFVTDEENEQYEFTNGGHNIKLSFDEAAEMNKAAFDAFVTDHKTLLEKIEEDAIIARTTQLIENRTQVLFALGVISDEAGENYFYKDVKIEGLTDEDLGDDDATDWAARLDDIKSQISDIQARKDADDAKAKQEQEAAEKAEKEARLPDLEKVELYANELMKVALPQLKNEEAANLLAELKNTVKLAVDDTITKIKKLS